VGSDVSGLARAQSPGLGLALVSLGFGNPEPGPNSGLAKARGLARAQARAYIPYIVIGVRSFKMRSRTARTGLEKKDKSLGAKQNSY
jgi:hypothetical protein